MVDKKQMLFAALGAAGLGLMSWAERRRQESVKQASGRALHAFLNEAGIRTNSPTLDKLIQQFGQDAVEHLMAPPPDENGATVHLRSPTQASQWSDSTIVIKDAEFTPLPPEQ